jgi:hypothetical protein
MTWSAQAQVASAIASSPHTSLVDIQRLDGTYITILQDLPVLMLHTQPDQPPSAYLARSAPGSEQIRKGDLLINTDYTISTYYIEGVRSDGAYILELRLRPHVV